MNRNRNSDLLRIHQMRLINSQLFGILNFSHCDFFDICDLIFVIFHLLKPEHRNLKPYFPYNLLSDIGIVTQMVVPVPGLLEMFILPPIASVILCAIANPKPVPVDFVVK